MNRTTDDDRPLAHLEESGMSNSVYALLLQLAHVDAFVGKLRSRQPAQALGARSGKSGLPAPMSACAPLAIWLSFSSIGTVRHWTMSDQQPPIAIRPNVRCYKASLWPSARLPGSSITRYWPRRSWMDTA